MLLAKLNTVEVLTSKALINSYSSLAEFAKGIYWDKRRNKKSWKFCRINCINLFDVSRETYEKKCHVINSI